MTLSHATQLAPNSEYVAPAHAAHPLWFAIGSLPESHLLQLVLALF
eukprot:SAG31_NODE_43904_length_265_cov_0.620482_1_plen_45_part_10